MTITNTLAGSELSYLSGMSATEGYQVLSKNIPQAVQTFEKTPQSQSDISYFEKTVSTLTSVNQFVSNPKLVDFVLSAFGLDSEDNYQGLIKQVLTQDPNSSSSLVNQLTDPRFKQLATALDFYSDGLGQIQSVGGAEPTTASNAEGVSLLPTVNGKAAATPVTVGLGVGGNEYLVLTKSDGTAAYAKSATFTLNSNNQLATSDGSILKDGPILPEGTTAVTVTATGSLYAQVKGQTAPQEVGTLEIATFKNSAALSKSKTGELTATPSSGAASLSFVSNNSSYAFGNTMQTLVNDYVQNGFEEAVGDNNSAVREALYFTRNISNEEKEAGTSKTSQALVILGDSVLDNVATTAMGEPAQIAYQPLSAQENIIESGMQLNQLQTPKYVAQFTAQYLAMYDANNAVGSSSTSSSSPALQILQAFGGSSSDSSASSSILSLAV